MMENFFSSHDEDFEGIDARLVAQQFEDRLASESNFYMDLATIDEVFDYYRVMDEPEKAQALLAFALAQYPYNGELRYKKSLLAYEAEEYAEAFILIKEAVDIAPSEVIFLIHKAKVQSALGDFEPALETLQHALDYAEDVSEVYYQLGSLCQTEERYRPAIDYYTQAITANPEYEDALFEVVYCFETLGALEEGIRYCERFLDGHPYSSCGWYNLGLLNQKQGLLEQAIFAFEYAILIQEDFISAYYGKASALMDLQKHEEAIRVLVQSLHYDKNDIATLVSLGECYENLGDYARARFYFSKCTEIYAGLPDAWYGIGSTLEAESRYLEAIHYYKKAIELNKEYFDAWLGLADCEYYLGNDYSAYEALKQAIQLYPQDLEMWRTWAERLNENHNPEGALTLLSEGIRHNAGAAELIYQYAAYALVAGKSKEAYSYLENALLMDYEKHSLLYSFCPKAAGLAPVAALVQQYRPA